MANKMRFPAMPAITRIRLIWQNWRQIFQCRFSLRMNRPESAKVLQLRSHPPEWFGLGWLQGEVAIIRAASTMGISRHFDYAVC